MEITKKEFLTFFNKEGIYIGDPPRVLVDM